MSNQVIPIIPIVNKRFSTKNLKGSYCLSPFINIHITTKGDVFLCPCPGWGDTRIGNILTETLDQMLSSLQAQSIRQSIIDGTYNYCNENQCALLINNSLNTKQTLPDNVAWQLEDATRYNMPYEIVFTGDITCNLSCPSCRTQVIKVNDKDIINQESIGQLVFQNVFSNPTDTYIHLVAGGAGELFASPMLQSFLSQLTVQDFPNLSLSLHSNGLLAEKKWNRVEHLESNIKNITISVDAARPDTYEQVRRGGKWIDMLTALKFFQNKKQVLDFKFNARMIVQQTNYQEMIEFYHLCKSYNVDRIEYSRLVNWKTWTNDEFIMHDVLDQNHPKRSHALELIAELKALPDVWFEGNFN